MGFMMSPYGSLCKAQMLTHDAVNSVDAILTAALRTWFIQFAITMSLLPGLERSCGNRGWNAASGVLASSASFEW
jgi:hypothetical protein